MKKKTNGTIMTPKASVLAILVLACIALFLRPLHAQLTTSDLAAQTEDFLFLSKSNIPHESSKALEFSLKALKLAKQTELDSLLARSFKSAGVAAYYNGQKNLATSYYDSALIYYQKLENQQEIANIHNNLGVAISENITPHAAIDHYLIALEINRKLLNTRNIGNLYNNIGAIYYRLRDFEKALEYFEMASRIAEMRIDNAYLLTTQNNIGLATMDQGRYNEAKSIFLACIHLAEKTGDNIGKANSQLNLGNIYIELKQPDSALFFFNRALNTYRAHGMSQVRTLLGIARSYVHKHNLQYALRYYSLAIEEEKKMPDQDMRLMIMEEMAEIKAAQGHFKEAYPLLKSFISDYKLQRKQHDSAAVRSLQTKFEVDQKMKEIQQLKNEQILSSELLKSQKQRNRLMSAFLWVVVAGAILLILYFLLYFNMFRKIKAVNAGIEVERSIQENRFGALQKERDQLAAKHAILQTVLQNSSDIIILKDGYGRWLMANKAAVDLFGFADFDFTNKTDEQLSDLFPFHRQTFRSFIIADDLVWQRAEVVSSEEVILDAKNADPLVFEAIRIPIYTADMRRKNMLITSRDITSRKNTEDSLSNALLSAKNAEEVKASFFASLSHGLRTSLNTVLGFSELLASEAIDPFNREQYLYKIKDNTALLHLLIDDILNLAQIESGESKSEYEVVDINGLMDEISPILHHLADAAGKADLTIELKYFKSDTTIMTDQLRLKQIIRHLFEIALKYTNRGKISVDFSLNKVSIPPQLVCMIEDSGTGMPNELKELIYNPEPKVAYPRIGNIAFHPLLAINIVKKIVKIMNGQILLDSSVSKGSKIRVLLPVRITEHAKEPPKSAAIYPYDFSGKVILIVEDVESNFDLLRIILEGSGAEVIRIENGIEAVEYCKNNQHIDLVLMDIQLPGINGYEATKQIKKIRPELPVLAQTALAMSDDKDLCLEAGCDGYIAKPIKPRLLLPVVSQFFE